MPFIFWCPYVLWFRLNMMTIWNVVLTHFYQLTEVVRGSEASNLHILLIIRPALQYRGNSLEMGKKRRIKCKIRRLQTRERWDERKRIRGGGVLDEKLKRKEKEELFSKGLETTRRIKPSRNSFALWGHRCTGFKPLFGGTDSSSVGCAWGETQNDAF